ncbi:MAG: site-2 protease family protein [Rubricoccaceae bacterium]
MWLHVALFLATLASATWVGGELVGRDLAWLAGGWPAFVADGLRYAVPFLFFLAVHEFGHYVAARRVGLSVSLPYFLPVPIPGTLGTLGAVIRIREPIRTTRQLFDVGASGPLAGFVVALALLVYAVAALPPPTYLLSVSGHAPLVEAVLLTGEFPPVEDVLAGGGFALVFGETPLFSFLLRFADYVPPGYELMHYPVLMAAWLGMFFTALNLLPVGQLDGGHVVYALFGEVVHRIVARVATLLLLLSGGLGLVADFGDALGALDVPGAGFLVWLIYGAACGLVMPKIVGRSPGLAGAGVAACVGLVALTGAVAPGLAAQAGFTGWLLWVALIAFVIRVDHPPVLVPEPLSAGRRALGYACLALFPLCFSIRPLYLVGL